MEVKRYRCVRVVGPLVRRQHLPAQDTHEMKRSTDRKSNVVVVVVVVVVVSWCCLQAVYHANTTSVNVEIYRGLNADGTDRIGPTDSPATVYYYLLSSSAVWGVDFAGANGSIGFSNGVTTSRLRIDILSTTFAVKNFTIELHSPFGDVVLAEPAAATVMVYTSPGTVGWMPSDVTPLVDNGTSLSLRLLRTVGVYGAVTVRWSLRLGGHSAGAVTGVSPTSGVEVFNDGVDALDVLLSPVPGGPTRPVQLCVAVLNSATGGATLADGSDTRLLLEMTVVVADSGLAYGNVQLSPANCSLTVVCAAT